MGNSNHGTTYMSVRGDDGELRPPFPLVDHASVTPRFTTLLSRPPNLGVASSMVYPKGAKIYEIGEEECFLVCAVHLQDLHHLQESLHNLLHYPQVHALKDLIEREREARGEGRSMDAVTFIEFSFVRHPPTGTCFSSSTSSFSSSLLFSSLPLNDSTVYEPYAEPAATSSTHTWRQTSLRPRSRVHPQATRITQNPSSLKLIGFNKIAK